MKPLALLLLLLLLLPAACSPDTAQRAHEVPRTPPSPSASLASQDRDFLQRAAEGNNAEVAMGNVSQRNALRPEVLSLGRMIAADHTAARNQLAAIAAAKQITLPTSLGDHQANYDRLVDLKGEEFDPEFVKVMLEEHDQALELFRGEATNGVDAELKAYAAAMVPKLEAHLAHAKALSELAQPLQ
jgi:putative membrane protein